MEVEVSAEAKDKRLNSLVALTVVVLSIFMGLSGVKDGNLVQLMQQEQASSIDLWNEYQATRIKRHVDEVALNQLNLSANPNPAAQSEKKRLTDEMAKYDKEAPELKKKATDASAQYDALNYHDDQFDAADALISIGVAVAAVAALAENWGALFVAWVFGGFGMVMGVCGFFNLPLHLDWLAKLLS